MPASAPSPHETGFALWRAVLMLGLTQIVAWGTLVYGIAVLAPPIAADLGISNGMVFGAFSLGLFFSGLASPAVGRAIDTRGGRKVMAAGSLCAALAMLTVASAQEPVMFFIGWGLAGIAMAANLYDAAFAALSQFTGARYRKALTVVTLMGGLASTAFWPLAWVLEEAAGWRTAFAVFAVLHLLICLPLHLALPRFRRTPSETGQGGIPLEPPAAPTQPRAFPWLAGAFTLAAFVVSGMSAHVVGALQATGLDTATAIAAAALIGPMQVTGRILEFAFARHAPAIHVGLASLVTMLMAMALLLCAGMLPALAFACALAYGLGNGVLSIARGTVPAELFGRDAYGSLMGRLAQPAFFAKAVAPLTVAVLIADGTAYARMGWLFATLMLLAVVAYLIAIRQARAR